MKEIPLTQGQVALVDEEDYEFLINFGSWCAQRMDKNYYATTNKSGKFVQMHRLIVEKRLKIKIKNTVDHVDRDSCNNQSHNLRIATHSQNLANRGLNVNNVSGYKGVCWDSNKQKWLTQIMINRKTMFLGYFNDSIQAAKAYDYAAYSTWKEFAWLNFPLEIRK